MSVPLRIELEGSNRITESSGRIGIYLMSADGAPLDLTITGSGSLELEGNGSGIQTGGTVNLRLPEYIDKRNLYHSRRRGG